MTGAPLPRLRQAVLAATELDPVAERLRAELGLGEPFADPEISQFGLCNAVFALGDTFLEVVSPVREGTTAGRLLARRGGDCGYMLMFQVADLPAARERAGTLGMREVFEVGLDEMAEVHLHPADMRGAIVSLSAPQPPESWTWGGPHWNARSAPLQIAGATVGVRDAPAAADRWRQVVGGLPGVELVEDEDEPGLIGVRIAGAGRRDGFEVGRVRFEFEPG